MRKLVVASLLLVPSLAWAEDGGSAPVLIGGLTLGVLVCAALVAYRRALGALIASQYGALLAVYLAHQHREALGGAQSICNINSVINCDVVNTSRYAELAGVPIAILGFAFYVAMAWLSFRWFKGETKPPRLMLVMAALGVAYDVFLAWASYSLGAVCLFCTATWAVNVVLLVATALEVRSDFSPSAAVDELGGAIGFGLGGLIVGLLAYNAGGGESAGGGGTAARPDWSTFYEQPAGPVTLDGTEPIKGDPNAPYTLVEWADFQCPHCGLTFPELEGLIAKNPDLKLLYKHYPISQACNRFVEGLRHENACHAAAAAECARHQGRFWELSGQMFKNQDYLGKDDLRFMAEQVGLNLPAFESCMQDPATAAAVVADVDAGGTAQISGTPSFFLKGPFGESWVRVIGGPEAVATILAAARRGEALPPPGPPRSDR